MNKLVTYTPVALDNLITWQKTDTDVRWTTVDVVIKILQEQKQLGNDCIALDYPGHDGGYELYFAKTETDEEFEKRKEVDREHRNRFKTKRVLAIDKQLKKLQSERKKLVT